MRIEEVTRALASVLRFTSDRLAGSQRKGSAPEGKAGLQAVLEAQARIQALSTLRLPQRVPELATEWEKDLVARAEAKWSPPAVQLKANLQEQLLRREPIQATRQWDSSYSPEGIQERHPDNLFWEGTDMTGQSIFAPSDHIARPFSPTREDEKLALLIAQHVRATLPGSFFQDESVKNPAVELFLVHWLIRGAAIFLIAGCLAAIVSGLP